MLGRVVMITTPEGGAGYYNYDSYTGSGCTGTTPAPGYLTYTSQTVTGTVCYYYDSLGRVVLEVVDGYPSSCRRFAYDNSPGVTGTLPSGISPANPYGRLVEAETDNCPSTVTQSSIITDEWFSYDADGRVTDMWEWTPNSTQYYHSTATFNANGSIASLDLFSPQKYTVKYGIDGEGRWNTATSGATTVV
jgi:hypothetical protein